ncbi:DUF262 domain-containing protein [Rufibacter immobilis]|uniref:DUF262 domain-containing protein n=1 Tax=Rufibacter immobilis TaxID=1348778 RepID=UPI0035F07739
MVKVSTLTYNELFERHTNISVPEYQRPYRWSREKLEELLIDLEEFFIKKHNPKLEYYMGSLLFFNNDKEDALEIIDGQQRLTSLTLLYYVIEGSLSPSQNLLYNSHISFYHIKKNIAFLQQKRDLLLKLKERCFFDKVRFTFIVTGSEDNAFAFFDSQNSRGVTLGADDYLKAYHLRSVFSESLQETLAQEWEAAALTSQAENKAEFGLLHLFYKILYRAREWKGQTLLISEEQDTILKAFQKKTLESAEANSYELYPSRANIKYRALVLHDDDSLGFLPYQDEPATLRDFPFSVRQPLYKGHNFFRFTQKYHAIHKLLFSNSVYSSSSLAEMKGYYDFVYTDNMSQYLRHYMQVCLVMYFDAFGEKQINTAIQYFDYLIGSIRIQKYYVKKEAVKNSLMSGSSNLLDVIANSYLPQEIFEFIAEQQTPQEIYDAEKLVEDKGVRDNYKKRVIAMYGKDAKTLKGRLSWIR